MTTSERNLIINWFDNLAQLAKDHKTLTGHVMDYQECFDEMYVLSKGASEFIKKHWEDPKCFIVKE